MRIPIQTNDESSELQHTRLRVHANTEMRDFAVNLSRPFRLGERDESRDLRYMRSYV